jgi:hypothetical protein
MHIMEYYSSLRRQKNLTQAPVWMNLKNIKWNKPVTKRQTLSDSTSMGT